jgi:hypothetical protein
MLHAAKTGLEELDTRFTLALMQWGQYLDHDLTSTPIERAVNGSILV